MAEPVADYPTVPCRSCQAPIIWVKTVTGRSMPVDPTPTAAGNVWLEPSPHQITANVIAPANMGNYPVLRTSHFATCPEADQHRRPRS